MNFPTVDAYLASLPEGIASYPGCDSKASLIRGALDRLPTEPHEALPEEVCEVLAHPPPRSAWIPTTVFQCTMMAIRDTHFPGPGGEVEFRRNIREMNRQLFSTPLYRALFFLLEPRRLMRGIEKRWNRFHRGTTLEIVADAGQRSVSLKMEYPPYLFEHLAVRALADSFETAVELAGGKKAAVMPVDETSTSVLYRLTWS